MAYYLMPAVLFDSAVIRYSSAALIVGYDGKRLLNANDHQRHDFFLKNDVGFF